MIKVAFDYQVFFIQEYGGISRYFSKLAASLDSLEETEARIIAPLHINAYLGDLPAEVVRGMDIRNWRRSKKLYRAIDNAASKAWLAFYRPSVLHQTYFLKKSLAPKGTPLVLTVYDMIHEKFSNAFSQKDRTSELKRAAVERADHVICISKNTRNDLLGYFGTPEEKVSVVYIGFENFADAKEGACFQKMGIEKPYFLYVGQRSRYKNFEGFIRAFAGSVELQRGYKVVCFGGGRFRQEEKETFLALKLKDSQVIQVIGDDAALASFYQNAFAFVYPSLYEGFGIPPLEAMSMDCPVICSNTSSIPEVAGSAAEYFNPNEADSIRWALEHVAGSPSRRNELVRLGRERYRLFTWPQCAKETLAIYERHV